MPKSSFVDFKAVKAALTMEKVLEHYGLLDRFKRSGDSLNGPCPIHKGSNPTQFRVSISKNIWNCFSECKHGGNVLDFIARMENASIHAAALKAIEWFSLDPVAMSAEKPQEDDHPDLAQKAADGAPPKPAPQKPAPVQEKNTPNHKLPPVFRKSLELFNVDRAVKEPADKPLVIVEGFFDCMKLHQLGCRRVVALMGSTMSAAQEELIRKHTDSRSQVIVMLDEDEAGRAGREDIAVRLAKFVFVKIHTFEKPDTQPDNLTAEEVSALFI